MTARLVVLASGRGSNLQAILDACRDGQLDAVVVAVISDQVGSGALTRATAADVSAIELPRIAGEKRADYDLRLAAVVTPLAADVVVLAGWMRILSDAFLQRCSAPVVNLHPALPGEFPGVNAIERALVSGVDRTGVMVHFVPDEGVDDGPVIATEQVPILPDDTLDTLSNRIHATEHRLLISALTHVLNNEDQ